MTGNQTHGYDVVIEILESELNEQFQIQLATGEIPLEINTPIELDGYDGDLYLRFMAPYITLNPTIERGIDFHLPMYTSSLMIIKDGNAITCESIYGGFEITDRIERHGKDIRVNFRDGVEDIQVVLEGYDTETRLQQFENETGIPVDHVRTLYERTMTFFLIAMGDYMLAEDFEVHDFDVIVIENGSSMGNNALAILIRLSEDSPEGDPSAFNEVIIPTGQTAAITIAGRYILQRICESMQEHLEIGSEHFNEPCQLKHPVNIDHLMDASGTWKLASLNLSIHNGYAKCRATIEGDGTGWDAESNITLKFYPEITNNEITFRIEEDIDNDVDIEWWVYLLGILTGGVLFGVIGAGVILLILAFIDIFGGELFAPDVGINLTDLEEGIPLGPLGEDLNAVNILLDDWIFSGTVIRSMEMPIKHFDLTTQPSDFLVDLESGRYHVPMPIVSGMSYQQQFETALTLPSPYDLSWSSNEGGRTLCPVNGAQFTVMADDTIFELVSHVDLERLDREMSESAILCEEDIPIGFTVSIIGPANYVTLAVKTNEGRYAKCALSRPLEGNIQIRYITFDRPVPSVSITKSVDFHMDGTMSKYTCKAVPKMLVYPFTYRWSYIYQQPATTEGLQYIARDVRIEGSDSFSIDDQEIQYEIDKENCILDGPFGILRNILLCVQVTDHENMTVRGCLDLGAFEILPPIESDLLRELKGLYKWFRELVDPKIDLGPLGPDIDPLAANVILSGLPISSLTPESVIMNGSQLNLVTQDTRKHQIEDSVFRVSWNEEFEKFLKMGKEFDSKELR